MTPGRYGPGPVFTPPPAPPFSPARAASKSLLPRDVATEGAVAFGTASGRAVSVLPIPATLVAYLILWVAPLDNARIPMPNFQVTVVPTASDGAALDWQVQSASNEEFTINVALTTFLGASSAIATQGSVGPHADLTTVYLRARSGRQASDSWGLWANTIRVVMDQRIGNAAETIYLNAGFFFAVPQTAAESVNQNVGFFFEPPQTATETATEFVTTDTPTPYIFALRPTVGRGGDGFQILGTGFGASAATYGGIVEAYNPVSEAWESVGVLAWGRNAAAVNAYTATRTIDPSIPDIDPEHDVIDVTIPSWATPPSVPFRVRTDGP